MAEDEAPLVALAVASLLEHEILREVLSVIAQVEAGEEGVLRPRFDLDPEALGAHGAFHESQGLKVPHWSRYRRRVGGAAGIDVEIFDQARGRVGVEVIE